MKHSALWFIPSPPNTSDASTRNYNALITSIESRFPSAARLSLPWSLSHRLLRSTPPPPSTPTALPPSYHHILHLTLLSQSRTYCYIQPVPAHTSTSAAVKPEPLSQASTPQPHPSSSNTNTAPAHPQHGSIVSIPTTQSDPHIAFLCTQLSPLWSFRQALQIPGGITYAIGPYHISLGEVRASRSGAAAGALNTSSQGVVVAVAIFYPDDEGDEDEDKHSDDEDGFSFRGGGGENGPQTQAKRSVGVDFGVAEQRVRAVWDHVRAGLEFGKVEVREVMMGTDKAGDEGEAERTVRMWCEVLRLRA